MLFIERREHPSRPQRDLGFRLEKFSAVADVEARFAVHRRIDDLHRIDGSNAAPESARNRAVYGSCDRVEFLPRVMDGAEGGPPQALIAPECHFPAQGAGAATVVQLHVQVGDPPRGNALLVREVDGHVLQADVLKRRRAAALFDGGEQARQERRRVEGQSGRLGIQRLSGHTSYAGDFARLLKRLRACCVPKSNLARRPRGGRSGGGVGRRRQRQPFSRQIEDEDLGSDEIDLRSRRRKGKQRPLGDVDGSQGRLCDFLIVFIDDADIGEPKFKPPVVREP